MQQKSYQGRFVYSHNNQLESMSMLHIQDEMGRRERLTSLNGEARKILRDDNNLTCVWPSTRQIVVDKANPVDAYPLWIPEDVDRLGKFYNFELVGEDRIADHPAMVVSIEPMDELRYGMKVWIHKDNHLLLQSVIFDESGNKTEQIMFTELQLLNDTEKEVFSVVPQIGSGYALIQSHSREHSADDSGSFNWQITDMPDGFWLSSRLKKDQDNVEIPVQQMVLTDGMASVSVFIEPTSEKSLQGESSMGAVNAYAIRLHEYTITAIGEVPPLTVKTIAESVTYLNQDS